MYKVPENKYGWKETSRHQRGYGSEWDKLRKVVLLRDDYLCQECIKTGTLTPANHVDHIINKAKDGTDDPDNLQSLCEPCHQAKTLAETGRKPRRHRQGYDTKGNPINSKDWS